VPLKTKLKLAIGYFARLPFLNLLILNILKYNYFMTRNIDEIINNSISSNSKRLEGFFASKNSNTYFLGVNYSVAKTNISLSHKGSSTLDKIKVFDLAETGAAYIGQINMMIVSSFCGPNGLIWGYDVCRAEKIQNKWGIACRDKDGKEIKVYTIENLVDSFKKLTGTVDNKRFPFLAGSHVPCACKQITIEDKSIIYTALGIGIPEDRENNACLLMEDVGEIPLDTVDIELYEKNIIKNVTKSILKISEIQKIKYKEMFVGIKRIHVNEGEIGCALVAAPYFTLASDALPKQNKLQDLKINEWEQLVGNKFICNNN
jgi:histidine decarboxylase